MFYQPTKYKLPSFSSIFDQFYKNSPIPPKVIGPYRNIPVECFSDDFYSNLIDWSNSLIYYSINDIIYSYNFYFGDTNQIFVSSNPITSIKFNAQCEVLIIGTSNGIINYIDVETGKSSKYLVHKSRIGVIKNLDQSVITGSRDKKCKILDVRTKIASGTLSLHTQEICGLSISNDNLLASGGNDNKIFIYDIRTEMALAKLNEHKAAVKALCWSPNSSMLISGGGSADKTIKLWDVSKDGNSIKTINFESQVCNLKWLKNNRIVSTFGYSDDDIKLLEDFKITKTFCGHKNRVIHFSISDDEKYFVTGSGDGTIKFWEVEERNEHLR